MNTEYVRYVRRNMSKSTAWMKAWRRYPYVMCVQTKHRGKHTHGRLVAKRGVIYSTQLYIETMSKTLVIEDVHIRMDRYWEGLNDE